MAFVCGAFETIRIEVPPAVVCRFGEAVADEASILRLICNLLDEQLADAMVSVFKPVVVSDGGVTLNEIFPVTASYLKFEAVRDTLVPPPDRVVERSLTELTPRPSTVIVTGVF
jgi:hypothetical protein